MKKAFTVAYLLLTACGGRPAADPAPVREYPCVLHAPRELGPDLVVEQHVEIAKDGRGGAFDAVLQKRGDELIVVGLGPLGVRAFVIRQQGAEVTSEQRIGPKPPFPARNVVIDVHRAFFKRLEITEAGEPDGSRSGQLDGEEVVEIWKSGELVERRFTRPSEMAGAVRVSYGPGCRTDRCEPSSVRLVNEWFGYELRIENRRFHSIQ